MKILRVLVFILVWLLLLIGVAWAFGALWFDFPMAAVRKPVASGCLPAAWLQPLASCNPAGWRNSGSPPPSCSWPRGGLTLQPSQDRDWKPEVAILPHATINGDKM